jgi:hypothetical protein
VPNDAELPRWIKVKELFGEVEDPLNLLAEAPIDEVAEALIEDGWEAVSVYEHPATLGGRAPDITLEKPLPGLARLHVRLWRGRGAVGNAHLDLPTPAAFRRLSPHDALHDVGKAYVAYVFLRLGYSVDLIYLDNKTETSDGWAVKIFKPKPPHIRG